MTKVLLLGAHGYLGSAFALELQRRSIPFYSFSRKEFDYTRFDLLWRHLKEERPSFVINAAAFTGRPNVGACEDARAETLIGNTTFPLSLAHACLATDILYAQISSGCIYSGARVMEGDRWRVEASLMTPELRPLVEAEISNGCKGFWSKIQGFTEADPPNFSFRSPPCSFYSGAKALAEEVIIPLGNGYIWRLRMPFDEFNNQRNYLTKLQTYAKVYDNVNSISHRGDFACACLDMWERGAPLGVYNVTNPGWITARRVIDMIREILRPAKPFVFWADDAEFYAFEKTPRSNCVLDTSKMLAAGVKMRPVEEALSTSLRNWQT
jgi:dTDP-4-dehydrorhamnose reductase